MSEIMPGLSFEHRAQVGKCLVEREDKGPETRIFTPLEAPIYPCHQQCAQRIAGEHVDGRGMQFTGNEGRRKSRNQTPMKEADEPIPHFHGHRFCILGMILIRLLHMPPENCSYRLPQATKLRNRPAVRLDW